MRAVDENSSTVCMRGTELPLVEPDQTCEACGKLGTAGRVVLDWTDRTEREIHRFCERCWPEECARYETRWKHRSQHAMNEMFRAMSQGDGKQNDNESQIHSEPHLRGIVCESATWHGTSDFIEKFMEVFEMVRSGRVPTEAELVETATQLAKDIESRIDTRVGTMPFNVLHFLQEFGEGSEAASAAAQQPKRPPPTRGEAIKETLIQAEARRMSRRTDSHNDAGRTLKENIVAAHASADAAIAEFDKALESFAVPTNPQSRALIEKELVGILQQLEQEIASEAATMDSWKSEMKAAAKSGDAYTAMKLSRLGEDRMVRLERLRSTMSEVEQLHTRLLGENQTADD